MPWFSFDCQHIISADFFFRTPLTNRAVLTVWLRNLSTNIAQQIAFVFYILIILDQHNHIHNRTSHIYILQHSVFVCVCVMSWTTWAATIAQNYQKRNELRKGNFNVIVKSHAKHHIFVFFFRLSSFWSCLSSRGKTKTEYWSPFGMVILFCLLWAPAIPLRSHTIFIMWYYGHAMNKQKEIKKHALYYTSIFCFFHLTTVSIVLCFNVLEHLTQCVMWINTQRPTRANLNTVCVGRTT